MPLNSSNAAADVSVPSRFSATIATLTAAGQQVQRPPGWITVEPNLFMFRS